MKFLSKLIVVGMFICLSACGIDTTNINEAVGKPVLDETIRVSDWEITFKQYELLDQINTYSMFYYVPDEDCKYLKIDTQVINYGDEIRRLSKDKDVTFELSCGEDIFDLEDLKELEEQVYHSDLETGSIKEGVIVFQIPEKVLDECQKLLLNVTGNGIDYKYEVSFD